VIETLRRPRQGPQNGSHGLVTTKVFSSSVRPRPTPRYGSDRPGLGTINACWPPGRREPLEPAGRTRSRSWRFPFRVESDYQHLLFRCRGLNMASVAPPSERCSTGGLNPPGFRVTRRLSPVVPLPVAPPAPLADGTTRRRQYALRGVSGTFRTTTANSLLARWSVRGLIPARERRPSRRCWRTPARLIERPGGVPLGEGV
jgi:hypothetical protein